MPEISDENGDILLIGVQEKKKYHNCKLDRFFVEVSATIIPLIGKIESFKETVNFDIHYKADIDEMFEKKIKIVNEQIRHENNYQKFLCKVYKSSKKLGELMANKRELEYEKLNSVKCQFLGQNSWLILKCGRAIKY